MTRFASTASHLNSTQFLQKKKKTRLDVCVHVCVGSCVCVWMDRGAMLIHLYNISIKNHEAYKTVAGPSLIKYHKRSNSV